MDFVTAATTSRRVERQDVTEVSPVFWVQDVQDLMIRGREFYAVWNEEKGLWSKREIEVAGLVDKELAAETNRLDGAPSHTKWMRCYDTGSWRRWRQYVTSLPDSWQPLDSKLVYRSDEPRRQDMASTRLPYDLEEGDPESFRTLLERLYEQEERDKLLWAIGSVVAGDSSSIQKFVVLYGSSGTGKSTVLNIIEQLFPGYTSIFDADALTSRSDAFASAMFRDSPLVAIHHDADLSRIDRNQLLNSIVSHEEIIINEKHKTQYTTSSRSMLFIGTNKPVRITDRQSGLIRRLIDVAPSGERFEPDEYQLLMSRIPFELGRIARYCRDAYTSMGRNYYGRYTPIRMMTETNPVYNFVEESAPRLLAEKEVTLRSLYTSYKEYCDESGLSFHVPKHVFKTEMMGYFKEFHPQRKTPTGKATNVFVGLRTEMLEGFRAEERKANQEHPVGLVLDETVSVLDDVLADCPAQYASDGGTPRCAWDDCTTRLKDLVTTAEHFVRPPEDLVVIDFDLRGPDGQKDPVRNLEAAARWPRTYTEFSRSGGGVHLHYLYDGDVSRLAREYEPGVEIKTFGGKSSLRRRLTACNREPVRRLSTGLPEREERPAVLNKKKVASEKALRDLIERNLRKEVHPATKPSVDFIRKILDDAYTSGMDYDVTDMYTRVMVFCANSTNNADYCLRVLRQMHFASEQHEDAGHEEYADDKIVFFDVEVFPNLFLVCWKYDGSDEVHQMVNPSPSEVESFLGKKLVGFNNRRYDNHILYARMMGYDNAGLFRVSKGIIDKQPNSTFREAYNASYADVYDFAATKMSLKKWEIELGITHKELDLAWDQPVPVERWAKVGDYCTNDVRATEAVFHHLQADFDARKVLAALSGLTVNDTTRQHMGRIMFGDERHPQDEFVYTDLSTMFPGYVFEDGHSTYRGEDPSEGGYVYAEPGVYHDVVLLDVASMHPTSIIQLNLFGPYTKRFEEIVRARLAIKNGDTEKARTLLNGQLAEFLEDPAEAKRLAYALKIVINSVYGLTAARFDNLFRDPRNSDNIVAKRGALFMIDLKHFVQEMGLSAVHIKTDSIKVPGATPDQVEEIQAFAKRYGYVLEHEATYDTMVLFDKAQYIARAEGPGGHWSATGALFQDPYVYKRLLSNEEIHLEDLLVTKAVAKGTMYLDFNEALPENEHDYQFVGRAGQFMAVQDGGELLVLRDDRYVSVAGTKGHRFITSDAARTVDWRDPSVVDAEYYEDKVRSARAQVERFISMEDLNTIRKDTNHG